MSSFSVHSKVEYLIMVFRRVCSVCIPYSLTVPYPSAEHNLQYFIMQSYACYVFNIDRTQQANIKLKNANTGKNGKTLKYCGELKRIHMYSSLKVKYYCAASDRYGKCWYKSREGGLIYENSTFLYIYDCRVSLSLWLAILQFSMYNVDWLYTYIYSRYF